MSSDLIVQGIKITNSPEFHLRFDNCASVHTEKLNINSPAQSRNTDGIHIENTNNVVIYNSFISCGDDCVSIGAGSTNVYIRNITCGPSHGISIGSLGSHNSRACVSNITVADSLIKHSYNGVRIKTGSGGEGAVSKVTFNNIQMDTVFNPITRNQYHCPSKLDCFNQSSAVFISNVVYSNIKGTYDVRRPAVHFGCSVSVPCVNITLSQVDLRPAQGKSSAESFCTNAYGTLKTLTVPRVRCLLKGNRVVPTKDVVMCLIK